MGQVVLGVGPTLGSARTVRGPAPGRNPDIRLETFVVSDPRSSSGQRRSILLPASLVLHILAVGAWLLASILATETLPEPNSAVRAFFVGPAAAPPPRRTEHPKRRSFGTSQTNGACGCLGRFT